VGGDCLQHWKAPPNDLVANRPWITTRGRGILHVDDNATLSDDMILGITGECFSVRQKRKLENDVCHPGAQEDVDDGDPFDTDVSRICHAAMEPWGHGTEPEL